MSEPEKDEFGTKMLYHPTGQFVDMQVGGTKNGQRYNCVHRFKNYMMIGYFKTGKGQKQIEMKTDGPNHKPGGSDCTDLPKCCWTETDLMISGKPKLSSEYPHPHNHDAVPIDNTTSVGSLKERWIGYAVVAYQTGQFRTIEQWCDPNPFDTDGKPKNGWVTTFKHTDKGDVTTPELAKRPVPPADGSVLESEIRMFKAKKHHQEPGGTDMKWCRVYEISPPS